MDQRYIVQCNRPHLEVAVVKGARSCNFIKADEIATELTEILQQRLKTVENSKQAQQSQKDQIRQD